MTGALLILAGIVLLTFLAFCYGERQWMKKHKGCADKFLAIGCVLTCLSSSGQLAQMPTAATFFTTNCCATNVPTAVRPFILQWWMQCHPELLTDVVQVAIEYRTNIVSPWLLRTQWMQGIDHNPKLLTWAFTASNRQEFYRVRSTRIYP